MSMTYYETIDLSKHSELILVGKTEHKNDRFIFTSGEIWCAEEKTRFVSGRQTMAGPRGPGPIATLGLIPRELLSE